MPRLILTGASGFLGRHLLERLKERYQILGLARRSQVRCGAPFHDNITWFQVDIGEREPLAGAFRAIRETGGADYIVHLAAHYDFTGEKHPEYWRTNVDGLRNVLEESQNLGVRRFVFASSVAACSFPSRGEAITEETPPDGEHVYAVTKRIGEAMLAEYDELLPSCIVRFAAMFSDWCEYPPLYFFLETWLSGAWNSRILGGRGESAIPYLHVRDACTFVERLLERADDLGQREVLSASTDGSTSHRELFDLATLHYHGRRLKPVLMPGPLCVVGVWGRDLMGRMLGNRPFERPWMVRYIDEALTVDAARSRRRLDWEPRDRLLVERRMPFMVEHMKREPVEWHRLNREAMKKVELRDNLRIHRLLEKHHDEIRTRFVDELAGEHNHHRFPNYQKVNRGILEWRFTVVLRHLLNAVRTGDKGVFNDYCRDLGQRRHSEGFDPSELCGALQLLDQVCVDVVRRDEEGEDLAEALHDHVSITVRFGCDQVLETFEELGAEV